jgi:penicillin-binding protein 1A
LQYRENQEDKVWSPKNSDGRYSWNNYTLRKAMAKSVNSVAVALTMRLGEITPDAPNKKINKYYSQKQYDMEQGTQAVINTARKLGIKSRLEPIPALSLGAFDVNLYEMVAAYSVFLNKGIYTEPQIVTKIEDRNGKVLYEFKPKTRKALSPETAYLMTYMLRGGVEEGGGTSKGLFNYDLFPNYKAQMAGKTGTTSNYSDAWYIGMSQNLVSGVWVGGDDRSIHFRGTMGEGSSVALPIFGRYMELVFKDKALIYKPGAFPKATFPIDRVWDDCAKWEDPFAPKPSNQPAKDNDTNNLEVIDEAILSNKIEVDTAQ